MEWHDEFFVAENGPHGRIRVFQKAQNLMMHAGSRTQAAPRNIVFRWVKKGRKYYLQVSRRSFEVHKDFWSTKLTYKDEVELGKRERFDAARRLGIRPINSFFEE